MGGAVYSTAGVIAATNTLFATNTAIGGHTKVGAGGLIGPVGIASCCGAGGLHEPQGRGAAPTGRRSAASPGVWQKLVVPP
jgi:hypothetical protein